MVGPIGPLPAYYLLLLILEQELILYRYSSCCCCCWERELFFAGLTLKLVGPINHVYYAYKLPS